MAAEEETRQDTPETSESGTPEQAEATEPQTSPAEEAAPEGAPEAPKYENKVTVEEVGPCRKKLTIEVPQEAIRAALDGQFAELKRDAVVPGFRRGRAPLRLLEKRFGTDVRTQVKLKLMADASERAIEDQKLDMLGDPDIDHEAVELPEEGPMTFSFEVDVKPDFELPVLEGIPIEKPPVEVTDEQIDRDIEEMRQRAGVWVPKEGKVAGGDQVIADVRLDIDGVDEDERHDNVEIVVRERGFVGPIPVEGLDSLLTGAARGDAKTTTVEVAETFFNEDYRGKKVGVEITVKEVKELKPAALDEDFFRRYGVDDEDDLRERLREHHQDQAEQAARSAMSDQVYRYLLDNTSLELPVQLVADQAKQLLQRQFVRLLMQGVSREQIEQQMQQLQAASDQQAAEQLKLLFIMGRIAEMLGVEVTEEEVNGYVAQAAVQRGRRPEKMREELARDGSLAQFAMQVREHKCIEKLLEKAEIKETSPAEAPARKPARKSAEPAETVAPAEDAETPTEEEPLPDDTASERRKTSAKRTRKTTKKDD